MESFKDPELGMTGCYKCLISKFFYDSFNRMGGRECFLRLRRFMTGEGLPFTNFSFVAGSIFLCRSSVLRPIKNLHLQLMDFEISSPSSSYPPVVSLAHVMERMFGYYTEFLGYKCSDYVVPKWKQFLFFATCSENREICLLRIKRFILHNVLRKKQVQQKILIK